VPTRSVAIYARISRDRSGDLLGVERQEKACRQLAKQRGWAVAPEDVFVDDDQSAYSGKPRPAYRRMLDGVRSGRIGVILAMHPDRLHRSPRELEDFIDLIEATGCAVETVNAGRYDLTNRSGRTSARLIGAISRDESEAKSERLRDKHQELADSGRWKGGPRPYGYDIERDGEGRPLKTGRLVVQPAEAEVIKEAAARVLAGETLYGVCADFNRHGIPTAQTGKDGRAGMWRTPTLRRILTAGTLAGYRERGNKSQDDLVKATWEPILDEVTWRRLRTAILETGRSRTRPARAYLLTGGTARCGNCGRPLHAQRKTSGSRQMACIPGPDKGGCGKLTVAAERVEEMVTEALFEALDTPRLLAAMRHDRSDDMTSITKELGRIETKLEELGKMWAADELSRTSWMAARKPLEARRDELHRQQATTTRGTALMPYTGTKGALRKAWPTLTLDQRRAVVAAVIEGVTVAPASRRGRIFDPARVTITWRV
jgi:DNA invertase Pin-like site-specific DNA recombinase